MWGISREWRGCPFQNPDALNSTCRLYPEIKTLLCDIPKANSHIHSNLGQTDGGSLRRDLGRIALLPTLGTQIASQVLEGAAFDATRFHFQVNDLFVSGVSHVTRQFRGLLRFRTAWPPPSYLADRPQLRLWKTRPPISG